MSLFKIKVKTLSGNDIGHKKNFTAFFRGKFGGGTKSDMTRYNFRIIHPGGYLKYDAPTMFRQAPSTREDMILKIILNILYLVRELCGKYKCTPDFITIISPDLKGEHNESYKLIIQYLNDEEEIDEERIRKYGIDKENLQKLQYYKKLWPTSKILTIDPHRDEEKYKKSLIICNELRDKLDGYYKLALKST